MWRRWATWGVAVVAFVPVLYLLTVINAVAFRWLLLICWFLGMTAAAVYLATFRCASCGKFFWLSHGIRGRQRGLRCGNCRYPLSNIIRKPKATLDFQD